MTACAAAMIVSAMLASAAAPQAATAFAGRVVYSGIGVPGATVIASREGATVSTITDDSGLFHFAALGDGAWQLRIQMRGFATVTQSIVIPYTGTAPTWQLTMQPYAEIVGGMRNGARPAEPAAPATALDANDDVDVINGSVNNGGATRFAQAAAFGNNRLRAAAKYSGGVTTTLGNSAWNARPFSFGGASDPPDYGDLQIGVTVMGPLKIPHLLRNGPQFTISYQHGVLHSATTQSALVPTAAERAGDFSSLPSALVDPLTGLPFDGNVIPPARITPQAAALLAYYPGPNSSAARGANFQKPLVSSTTQDVLQFAMSIRSGTRTTIGATFAYRRAAGRSATLFDFVDATAQSSLDDAFTWTRRLSTRTSVRARYQLARTTSGSIPFFAGRTNVSSDAGIAGNSQDANDWGPPTLSFPDIAGLRDADYERSVHWRHAAGLEVAVKRGAHNVTIGGDVRRDAIDVSSRADARGTLGFTGAASGNAFADFLLGIPATTTIGIGNGTGTLRAHANDAYVADDWRVGMLTLNLGVRWEFESPFSGSRLPSDKHGLEPRLSASWRPIAGSSLVLRASYGMYRNLGVYQPLAVLLSRQPPSARTLSVQNSPQTPLTLANPFPASLPSATTFEVDPGFRVGYAHNWTASAQRDLPASLTAIATYSGAKGSHLMQASLPNTYPAGAVNPCPACPTGFVRTTSGGASLRHAAQLTLRRRLHNGLTTSVQYTFAQSTDDAATFSNTAVSPHALSIAQDWLHLDAERGPSSFDQRHAVAAQFQYTSGVGAAGGTLVDNAWGTILEDWTIGAQLNAASGLPFTPVAFVAVGGTGFVGVRPRLTGVSPEPVSHGSYANPAAYAPPAPGAWGNAGRHSIRGPAQTSLDASVSRVFRLRGRVSLETRAAATNVLNTVTFATIGTVITSSQFGLPTLANPMRRVQLITRLRF